MAKPGNSSNLAHDLLWQALKSHQAQLGDEDLALDLDEKIDLPWAESSFKTLEADPPWSYEDNGFNGFQTVQEYRIHCPYRTMRFRNILAAGEEVQRVMKPDSHCYLWTTKDFLMESLLCMKLWGYTFKNMVLWLKTSRAGNLTYGMGHWYRNGWEAMLFGVRGNPGRPAEATSQPNWFCAPKPPALVVPGGEGWTKHSRKPQEAYDLICRNSPGPRLSLFQRGSRDGFYCWGDESIEGLDQEWQGEVVEYDDTLCFGVDQEAGDVSMTFREEEIEEIRTALQVVRDSVEGEELPESFTAIENRFSQVAEILEGVEKFDRNYLNCESKGPEVEPDVEELIEDGKPSADELAKWKSGMSEAAWKEAVEKGWIDNEEA